MKVKIASAIVAAGLLSGLALAQVPTDNFQDPAVAPPPIAGTTAADSGYAATGWNPALLLALGGGLGAGSIVLKGFLRARS